MASQGGGEVVKPTFVRAGEASFNELHILLETQIFVAKRQLILEA